MFIFVLVLAHFCVLILLLWQRSVTQHKDQLNKLLSQKKSSETRTGQIAEHFAPLLKEFKYDRKQARFLATPIDFIIFEEENQRRIRDQIKNKQVRWEVFRIKGDPE
jgi:predicted Holliday junction resolvase-like endonuclease